MTWIMEVSLGVASDGDAESSVMWTKQLAAPEAMRSRINTSATIKTRRNSRAVQEFHWEDGFGG